jgi:transcriptional regulator with XRE-family HTH domain
MSRFGGSRRIIPIASEAIRSAHGEGGFGMGTVEHAEEPALVRRQLGRHLRRLRLAAGKTHADAETAGMGHRSTLWRIEAGRAKARPSTVRALCWLYDVDDATSDALYAMARRAEQPGWWEEFRADLPTWFALYIELEAAARRISIYQPNVVDGLLQTPDYARAVLAASYPRRPAEDVERQVEIRLQRQQQLFAREGTVHLNVVLCESVLQRAVGGPAVLAAQRERLAALNGRGTVDLRVLTFAAGAHPAVGGGLTVLDLDSDADPDVVYLESIHEGRYLEISSELALYRGIFGELWERAIPLEEYL